MLSKQQEEFDDWSPLKVAEDGEDATGGRTDLSVDFTSDG
jgi:hypothetical protein